MSNVIKTIGSTTKISVTKNTNFNVGAEGADDYGPTESTNFFNGITPPPSGYTIYVHKVSQGPSIHVANNDNECIFFLKSFGATGDTISNVLAWATNQTNLWVQSVDITNSDILNVTPTPTPSITPTLTVTPTPSITPTLTVTPSSTPNVIVSSGLIMNWDIQNSSSYSGSGSSITDLKGNINGTMTGTIVYTNGSPKYLTIDGGTSEYIYTANINPYLSPANTGKNQSVFLWIYPTSNGVIYSEQGSLTPDGGWYDAQIQRDSSNRFLFGVWPYTVNSARITSGAFALNNWYYVGWTYNGTLTGYVNGSSVGSSTYTRQTPYVEGGSRPMYFNLGYPTTTDMTTTTTTCTYGFGACQVYNIGLSDAEVLQNYNTDKSKYGL